MGRKERITETEELPICHKSTEMEEVSISHKSEAATAREEKAAKKGRKMPSRNLPPLVVKPDHEFAVAAISGIRLPILPAPNVDLISC